MKNLSPIIDPKDIVTKEYADTKLPKPTEPTQEGQFAVFNADGTIKGITLLNLDKEAR